MMSVPTSYPAPPPRPPLLNEDWTVVALGLLIIAVSLAGVIVPVPKFGWSKPGELATKIFAPTNLLAVMGQFAVTYAVALAGTLLLRKSLRNMLLTFPIVFGLTLLTLLLAGNKTLKDLNLEAVILSLGIGLAVGNLLRIPDWLSSALTTELWVKIGLVLLGTSVIFGDILKAGSLGGGAGAAGGRIGLVFCVLGSQALKVDDELTMMLASAVSICGVSAAIATSGAIQGDSKKLSYVISLVLITAIPMLLLMPWATLGLELSPEQTGAWLGGIIDTTGAVVASGSLAGEAALKISTIVKFSQNVLLGVAAFAISLYWTCKKKGVTVTAAQKPTLGIIWEYFMRLINGHLFEPIPHLGD